MTDPGAVRDLYVTTPDGRLFTRVWGDAGRFQALPPIVLMHDSLGSVELWRDFPSELSTATGHPVVAYDRIGFGRSDPHPGSLDATFIRHEAESSIPALRAELGLDRMILFGHSVGGAMAVAAAAAHPDAMLAVVTESAQAFVEDRTIAGLAEAQAAFAAPGQLERLARYHGDKAAWVLDAWIGTWLSPEFAGWTLDDDLRRLQCPVLALHGDRDEYGSPAHPARIATRAAAGADMIIIEDCGHVPHREKPEDVLRAVCKFLGDVRALGR